MALGMSQYLASNIFNTFGNNTSFVVATPYIQLHVGDPGAAGTSNAAGNTTRKLLEFATALFGVMDNDVAVSWTSVSTTETYTHYSVHTAASGGNFLWSGVVTAAGVSSGDDFTIPVGDIDLAIPLAA